MKYSTLPDISKPVSRLVQGTMMMNTSNLEDGFAILDACLDAGLNTFDTAQVYGNGESERVLGRWIKERGVRDKVVILGKGAHHNQDRKRVTSFDIQADVQDSLARMKVDHIDLYLLHRDDPEKPVGPIVETLNREHQAGHIGAFGGSNWSVERIQEANEYAAANGLKPFVASSPNFSLGVQAEPPWADCVSLSGPDKAADRQWYVDNAVTLFTWSSLAGGFFSGRFRRDNLDTFTEGYDQVCLRVYCHEENFQRLDRVDELSNEKSMTVPQLALSYVLNQPQGIHALVGSRNPEEVAVNVAASEVELTTQEVDWLDLRA